MAGEPALIVDDTPLNLKLLTLVLTSKGYVVKTAATAEAARTILETFRPRVMLLDLRLPGMSGLELAKLLRADPVHRDAILIAVTASAMKGDDAIALAAGFDAYVTKPVDTRAFPLLVADLLARGRGGTK